MATKKKKDTEPERTTTVFNGPAGLTGIPVYRGMSEDLPPLWQVRLEDSISSFTRGEYGDAEFSIRLTAIFTHHPEVPANQRLDPKLLDRMNLSADTVREMIVSGTELMQALLPEQPTPVEVDEAEGEGGDAKNE